MNNIPVDSIVFSVTYENYIKYIQKDKPEKKLGEWYMGDHMTNLIKFAYTYLKDSDQMIVKKYYIDRFEKLDDGKYFFYFSKSEDIFFEYPHSTVQGRHYRSSIDLERCDKLSENEIKNRLEKSKNIKSEASTTKTKTSSILEPTKEELTKIRNEKFKDQPLPTAEQARKLIERVEDGEDADAVVTEFYLEKK
jgi:glycyl-tRNA synthetase (class II)